MLYKEQKKLASLDIAKEEKKGKITLVSANKELPYFIDLKNLIMKTAGLGDLLKKGFSDLQCIRFALVYGSIASGQETARSDIDLLVVGEINEEKILNVTDLIEKQVGREVNYILWSNDEFMQRLKSKHHLLADIAKKPVIMVRGNEDDFRGTIEEPNHKSNRPQ
jgi:predicted nucleotidyltransferase